MLVPRLGSCVSVVLPGALAPCVLRVVGAVGSGSGFRLRCVVAGPLLPASCLGRWSGSGAVRVPLSAVRRVLPSAPFFSRAARAALGASLCFRVPAV